MDMMINLELVRALRRQNSWSQDQLAAIAGISLRTVQRIEKDGRSSLESKKALAAAFEIDALDLEVNSKAVDIAATNRRGQKYGYAGAALGFIGAYTGITLDLIGGGMTIGEAGVYFGIVGALFGISCAAIGFFSRKRLHATTASP